MTLSRILSDPWSAPPYNTQEAMRFLNDQVTDDDLAEAEDPNALGTALSYIFLFFLIFGLSATVEIKNLKKQLTNRFAIGTGVTMQFLVMPILGFLAVMALKNQPGWTQQMGVSLLVVTSSPGGSYSNWWCSTFNADLALSVAMTTVSSILSIGMLPANLFLYTYLAYGVSEEESVVQALDFSTIFLALGIVLLAIISGLLVGYKFDNKTFHVLANRLGTFSGILLVLFSVFISSGADGAENNFWNQDWAFYIGVAFPCLVGISLANIISRSLRLAHPETVAISIECCYQNTGIATSVAIAMYDDKEERAMAVAVPLFYGVVEAVAIMFYCIWAWKVGWTKAPKDERLCTVISKTYEVVEEDESDHDDDDDENLDDEFTELGGMEGRSLAGQSQSVATSRFADERTVDSSVAAQQQKDSAAPQPTWFWQRWFGQSSSATAAQLPASDASAVRMAGSSEKKAVAAAMMMAAPSPMATLRPTSTVDTSPTCLDEYGNATGGATTPSSLALTSPGGESCGRDRSFTMETSASSNAPTTPATVREVQSVNAGAEKDLSLPVVVGSTEFEVSDNGDDAPSSLTEKGARYVAGDDVVDL
mmetsp:Transcript_29051/g.60787  ORF Transcript_29051/g.60787 Transcript_29051/m.60787 type:complete len:593 (-) Transcript_29051:238-2016(-)